jgi:hypothetical protein
MKDNVRRALDVLLDKHDDAKRAEEKKQAAEQHARNEFVRQFVETRDTIIRPAMQAMSDYLKERGHSLYISVDDGSQPSRLRHSITLHSTMGGSDSGGNCPHLTAICDAYRHKVDFHVSTISASRGGFAGGDGEAELSQITEELITAKMAKVIQELFK